MNGPRGDYTKWSKSDRERQIATCMWNLKKTNNNRQKTKLWLPKGVGDSVAIISFGLIDTRYYI